MLSEVQLNEFAEDIKASRENMNFCRKELALKARVGLRFVTNVEEKKELEWKKLKLLWRLLRLLQILELTQQAETVKEVIKKRSRPRQKGRFKFDKRHGGAVRMRPCKH